MTDFFSNNSIFSDSPALGEVDTLHEEQLPDAYAAQRHCETCFRPMRVEIPWAELFCIARSQWPQQFGMPQWGYSKAFGKSYPDVHCQCGGLVFIPFTPASAKRLVETAINSNVVSPAQMNEINRIHAALAGSARR